MSNDGYSDSIRKQIVQKISQRNNRVKALLHLLNYIPQGRSWIICPFLCVCGVTRMSNLLHKM